MTLHQGLQRSLLGVGVDLVHCDDICGFSAAIGTLGTPASAFATQFAVGLGNSLRQ